MRHSERVRERRRATDARAARAAGGRTDEAFASVPRPSHTTFTTYAAAEWGLPGQGSRGRPPASDVPARQSLPIRAKTRSRSAGGLSLQAPIPVEVTHPAFTPNPTTMALVRAGVPRRAQRLARPPSRPCSLVAVQTVGWAAPSTRSRRLEPSPTPPDPASPKRSAAPARLLRSPSR